MSIEKMNSEAKKKGHQPSNAIAEEDDSSSSSSSSKNSEAGEAPAGLVVPDTQAVVLPAITSPKSPANNNVIKKRATLIMQEVLNEPEAVRASASNP